MKFFILGAFISLLTFTSCKKNESPSDLNTALNTAETSLSRTTTQNEHAKFLEFFQTDFYGQFADDNSDIDINRIMTEVSSEVIAFSDSSIIDSLLILYVPIFISESDTNYLNVYAKKSDFSNNNFENFILTYHVPLEKYYDNDGIPYGKFIIDIYGIDMNVLIEEDEEHNLIERTLSNEAFSLNFDDQFGIIPAFSQSGMAVPTMECIDASLDKLECTCKRWCRIIKKLANTVAGVSDHADIATAVLWCSVYDNSPWGAHLPCED